MANKTKKTADESVEVVEKVVEEFDLTKKVKVHSIADWGTSFGRSNGVGSVGFAPDSSMLVERSEIMYQIQNGNIAFVGIDGIGSHATFYIEDARTRQEIGFEDDERKQLFLTEDIVKKMFELKSMPAFEKAVKERVVTRAEKSAIIRMIKKLELNDYRKIRYLEDYTGFKVE